MSLVILVEIIFYFLFFRNFLFYFLCAYNIYKFDIQVRF